MPFLLGSLLFFALSLPLASLEVFRPVVKEGVQEIILPLKEKVPFQIILEGINWVYQGKGEGTEFLAEAILSREVRFNFIPTEALVARVPLKFFSQDAVTGEVSLLTVFIEPSFVVESKIEFSAGKTSAPEEGQEKLIHWADRSSWQNLSDEALETGAERLALWGDFTGAIALTLEREKKGKSVARLLGDFYYQRGDNRKAYDAYQKALKESPNEEVLLLTVFLAMLEKEKEVVVGSLRYWVTTFPPPEEKAYLVIFHYLIEQEQWDSAMRWANLYPRFYFKPTLRDRYDFFMGQLMEGASHYRNLRMALSFYDKLIKEHPLSSYWKRAYERSLWLKGFYFSG